MGSTPISWSKPLGSVVLQYKVRWSILGVAASPRIFPVAPVTTVDLNPYPLKSES